MANDFNKPDAIYIKNKNGTFTNKLTDYVNKFSFSSMGSDINDINNDGQEDILVVDMAIADPRRQKQLFTLSQNHDKFNLLLQFNLFYQYPRNMLQLNNGNDTFSEIACHSGISETDWSWAPLIADFDYDGWKDIYISNGLKKDITDWDYKVFVLDSINTAMNKGQGVNLNKWLNSIPEVRVKNYVYRNTGTLKFENASNTWMDEPPSFSSGAAYADRDNDDDLDLIVNNTDDEAFIFKNNSEQNLPANYINCRFYSPKNRLNEVYVAKIKLTFDDGKIQVQHYDPQRGFLSTVGHCVHFGLGANKTIAKVDVEFPSGKKIIQTNVAANQTLNFYEEYGARPIAAKAKAAIVPSIFTDITKQNKFSYTHVEKII